MADASTSPVESLSSWWKVAALGTMAAGFAVLILLTAKAYQNAPPIPDRFVDPAGAVVFTADDVIAGQRVFLKHGLMDNGTIWGHGGYLGPDFSAQSLHILALDLADRIARERLSRGYPDLTPEEKAAVDGAVALDLKANRYDPTSATLALPAGAVQSISGQVEYWRKYFDGPERNGGLARETVRDPQELRQLTAFFVWTAWASAATRPGTSHSYTNNFPYEPLAGNTPTAGALIYSALSLVFLLGGGVAHYRADPGNFYGIDLARLLPSDLLRTWHLQLAILWIATAYVGGALFVAGILGRSEPSGQRGAINLLFAALFVVVVGSLLGEWAGLLQWLGSAWFWFGNQGWEFLEIGRFWQILLAIGLVFWFGLLWRAVAPAWRDTERRSLITFFLIAAAAIPVFYLPALFFDGSTHYTVADTWRFWIIHLWVEGFFELFVTVIVAIIFHWLGLVERVTALRVIYLDVILIFGGGLIGTGHHWYFTGQTELNMALSATFSALEVVPLTLLTLDAADFVTVTRGEAGEPFRHKWTFYFLMAVGFWNFTGAGVFGFLINMPIVSYFEAGTNLTPNHGHAAMMGVFGMLGVALMVFVLREVVHEPLWLRLEKYVRCGFWGLNIGLAMMILLSLLPSGVLQVRDVLENGYWHARSLAYLGGELPRLLEWLRLPGDLVFIFLGALPILLAVGLGYFSLWSERPVAGATRPVRAAK